MEMMHVLYFITGERKKNGLNNSFDENQLYIQMQSSVNHTSVKVITKNIVPNAKTYFFVLYDTITLYYMD